MRTGKITLSGRQHVGQLLTLVLERFLTLQRLCALTPRTLAIKFQPAHLIALLEASDFTSANIRIYGQLPETLKKPHRPLRRAYAKYWDQLFLDARRAGEIRADIEIVPLRIFVLGALNWTIEWFSLDSKDAVLKLARRTELLIFDGVKKA